MVNPSRTHPFECQDLIPVSLVPRRFFVPQGKESESVESVVHSDEDNVMVHEEQRAVRVVVAVADLK